MKITDGNPTTDITSRELLLVGSGSATKVVSVENSKTVSVFIYNRSGGDYTVYNDSSAYFAWALRLK